ncbi:MAG: type VI secretion system tip protein VgrG [Planctomycetes bacterium]|nr:type VI secretion system tip protein VgrG [Planctomycetota bacterium]
MADIATTQVMQFHSDAVDDGDLQITKLEGEEGMNRPYEFHLELASTKTDIDHAEVLKKGAWIGIKQGIQLAGQNTRAATTLKIHGVVQSFEQVGKELELVKYRAVIVPKLQRLALQHQSRIFQNKKIPDIIKAICDEHSVEADFSKLGSYDEREYVVQYEETDLDFIHRWMEHEGIFYYFVQSEDFEKVVFADAPEGYGSMQGNSTFSYKPSPDEESRVEAGDTEDAAEDWFKEEVITSISAKTNQLPKKVILKDYNWQDPDTDLKSESEIHKDGVGIVYKYNNHYQTKEQGKKLADIRAQEINCRETVFKGTSDCRGYRAGMVFSMEDHFRNSMNTNFLLVEVKHRATQAVALGTASGGGASYSNTYTAILKDKTFRPEFKTKWPQIKGVMHAKVDGGDAGTPYAQLDDKGRYKIKMPIDLGTSQDGSASKYIRKSEPYAGPNQGMHFPLLKNSEVILTHVDGDPDRPVVAGAMFNSNNGSVVSQANSTQNVIATPGANKIILDDTVGSQFIHIQTIDDKNKIYMDGTDGSEKITIQNPKNKLELDGDDRITIKCDEQDSLIRLGKSGGGSSASGKVTDTDGIWMGTKKDLNQLVGGDLNVEVTGKENKHIAGASSWTNNDTSAEYKYGDWFSFKASASVATSIGISAAAQIGAEVKVAYAASASVTRGDGFAATWGKTYKLDKSSSVELDMKDRKLVVLNDKSIESKLGNVKIDSLAGQVVISAGTKIVLECGASKIEMTPNGIKITSGAGAAGSRTTLGPSMTQIKGSNINIQSRGPLSAKGTPGGQYK